jgi:hypothetical protein
LIWAEALFMSISGEAFHTHSDPAGDNAHHQQEVFIGTRTVNGIIVVVVFWTCKSQVIVSFNVGVGLSYGSRFIVVRS